MAEKRRLTLLAGFLLLACLSCLSYGDECQDQCTAPCDALKCQMISPTLGGCWFDGANCWSCTGSKAVTTCEQYGKEDSCQANTCGVPNTCKWVMGACVSTGIAQSNCKTEGCAFSYKCMADGECVHFSVSTQDYCRNAYTEHGFSYNLSDPASCDKVDEVCKKTDKKCQELSDAGAFSPGTVVAHCCGALGSDALAPARDRCGCLLGSMHPLQTFPTVAAAPISWQTPESFRWGK